MSEKLKESLSAVIDGEADEFELRRVLDEMGRNDQLALCWERYHVIGSVIRGERTMSVTDMRERVWAELQAEPETDVPAAVIREAVSSQIPAPVRDTPRRWAPYAVAASVAAAALVGYLGYSEPDQGIPVTIAAQTEPAVVPAVVEGAQSLSGVRPSAELSTEITDSDQIRTQAYMVRHYQQIGMDRPGLGFARMVAYERN